jgi:hypothetical protein
LIFMLLWWRYHLECDVQTDFWLPMDGAAVCRTYRMVWWVCDLANYFSHPSLVIYWFPTPPKQLKLVLLQTGERLLCTNSKAPGPAANRWETTLY